VLSKLLFGSDYTTEAMDTLWRHKDVTKGAALSKMPLRWREATLHWERLVLLGLEMQATAVSRS
jgi:hypothetical protein